MDEQARITGSLVGLAIGDALGHPTEFLSMQGIRARYGEAGVTALEPAGRHAAGTFTDDTQMSICVARALARTGGRDLEATMGVLAAEFVAWAGSPENNRAPGGACMQGCRSLREGVPWRQAGVVDSKGCGAAMRAAPFGLFFFDDEDALVRWSAAQSSLTHRHPTGIASSVAAAAAVAHVMATGSLDGLVVYCRELVSRVTPALLVELGCTQALADTVGNREMLAALDQTAAALDQEADDVCELLGGAWIGEEAVATALWCVVRAGGDYRQAVLRGVNSSGDSDSIACIAGSIVGALRGTANIPETWRAGVEKPALLEGLARAMFDAKHGSPRDPLGISLDPFGVERTAEATPVKDDHV